MRRDARAHHRRREEERQPVVLQRRAVADAGCEGAERQRVSGGNANGNESGARVEATALREERLTRLGVRPLLLRVHKRGGHAGQRQRQGHARGHLVIPELAAPLLLPCHPPQRARPPSDQLQNLGLCSFSTVRRIRRSGHVTKKKDPTLELGPMGASRTAAKNVFVLLVPRLSYPPASTLQSK